MWQWMSLTQKHLSLSWIPWMPLAFPSNSTTTQTSLTLASQQVICHLLIDKNVGKFNNSWLTFCSCESLFLFQHRLGVSMWRTLCLAVQHLRCIWSLWWHIQRHLLLHQCHSTWWPELPANIRWSTMWSNQITVDSNDSKNDLTPSGFSHQRSPWSIYLILEVVHVLKVQITVKGCFSSC